MTTDPRDMVACMCGHLVWHHTSSADSSVPFAGKCITPGCRCEMYRPWLKVVEEVGGGASGLQRTPSGTRMDTQGR